MPASLGEYFAAQGYQVYAVGELLPAGSPDASVVAAALDVGAIIVTMDSDFRSLRANNQGYGGRLERSDRIFFKKCSHAEALGRIQELIDTINAEYQYAKAANRKFFMQITRDTFTVWR